MKNFNNKYYYRVTEKGQPVPGTLSILPTLPKIGRWKEVKSVCCETLPPICPSDVLFTCLDPNFYMEFVNPDNGGTIAVYPSDASEFRMPIPRGIYNVYFYSIPIGSYIYINGEPYMHTTIGNPQIPMCDTTNIVQIGLCGYASLTATGQYEVNTCVDTWIQPDPLTLSLTVGVAGGYDVSKAHVEYVSGVNGTLTGSGASWTFTVTDTLVAPTAPDEVVYKTTLKVTHPDIPVDSIVEINIASNTYLCE